MAINMADALDGLRPDEPFGISSELDLDTLFASNGDRMATVPLEPRSLQTLLRRMAQSEISD